MKIRTNDTFLCLGSLSLSLFTDGHGAPTHRILRTLQTNSPLTHSSSRPSSRTPLNRNPFPSSRASSLGSQGIHSRPGTSSSTARGGPPWPLTASRNA